VGREGSTLNGHVLNLEKETTLSMESIYSRSLKMTTSIPYSWQLPYGSASHTRTYPRSRTGFHAMYERHLPDDVKEAVSEPDTEPCEANALPPAVETYDGKPVHVATGAHVLARQPTFVGQHGDRGYLR
jgi:hypothetical protein